ncbi:hypothetical protein LX92_04457 [Maribacter polysiphoniae]|uniref:Uncharacterized protein n=1 Tax=Maribacter polysiphoniae TaxID=429344 RepID=A0A316DH69_9FLAO|nr:hypothetical protein LX92_04457 [Maribacter polysiphoniae]
MKRLNIISFSITLFCKGISLKFIYFDNFNLDLEQVNKKKQVL